MSDIADFLRARYRERRVIAEAATHNGAGRWTQTDPQRKHGWVEDDAGETVVFDEGSPTGDQAQHIAANDPADVLADLDAKLAIVDTYEQTVAWYNRPENQAAPAGEVHGLHTALRHLARPFAGHLDYKEDWAA